jgi:serine phosphatase RsbU (regulator of sigma subunit)/ligand-binding sensor domain-containing protein
MQKLKRFQITFSLFLIVLNIWSQQTGTPFITNYPPDLYKAQVQNFAIAQDKRGVKFFGNSSGVLEYDGNAWRLIKTPSQVSSIAVDSTGIIYVGIIGDFGYLHPDSLGRYQYLSLKEKIPQQHREFNTVWSTFASGNRIFFQSFDKIFILQNGNIRIVYPKNIFLRSFLVDHSFYVLDTGQGLMTYKNDTLQLIEGGERFADERIYVMLPWHQDEILISTRTKGIWIYSPQQDNKFYKPVGFEALDHFLIKNLMYCGTVLDNGLFAIGTITGGIVVFNQDGNIQTIYNTASGLNNNAINCLYYDNNKLLWADTDNGISMVQINVPFQRFTEKNGLKGIPMCIDFFNDRLYVGTSQNLCVQNPDGNFDSITGTEDQNWQLLRANGTLLLADNNGLFEIKEKQAIPVIKSANFLNLCPLNNKPDYLLAGFGMSGKGLCLLEYDQKRWKIKNTIKGFTKNPYFIIQDKEENIWVWTYGLYKLKLNEDMDSAVSVMQFTTRQGLPTENTTPYLLKTGEVVFGTEKGIYRYHSATNTFEQHPDFKMLTGTVNSFQQQKNGDIWFQENMGNGIYETGILKCTNSGYQLIKQPFYKFNDYQIDNQFYGFYVASDSVVFIGTNKGLLQYNPMQKVEYNTPFHTLIRKVLAKDSLLFGGATDNINEFENIKGGVIPYRQNDLVFHYAAVYYEDAEKNLYSYRLLGSDTTWSAWVSDFKKEYTNLSEGKYNFEVKSKNQYKITGKTASYSFRILPPWYRTWWAYGGYLVLLILIMWVVVKINIQRLVKQKEELEVVVSERTAEVVKQKKQIEMAHEQITASINYAQYIQSSAFPKEEQIEACLGEHFILLKPAEVVSGDFYWVSETENKTIVAAADCTGHGVPGAFMSMLGITLLNEIVNKESNTDPGTILDRLRMEVLASLKQKGDKWEQKDGMDIAICTIDRQNMKLQFAGAINPLCIIRKSSLENIGIIHNEVSSDVRLIEIKGDPMPIGITDEMNSFTCQEIDIQKGDSFYLFTDGFPDQFGGTNHKKFSHKQFRDLLVKTKTKTMSGQKLMLEKILNEWMGNTRQTDDILVIGFRIN